MQTEKFSYSMEKTFSLFILVWFHFQLFSFPYSMAVPVFTENASQKHSNAILGQK